MLFFVRDSQGVYKQGYVGELSNNQIRNLQKIDKKTYHFLSSYKSLQAFGFTEKINGMVWFTLRRLYK